MELEVVKRGVTPPILLEQVRNTVPFALHPDFEPALPYLNTLRAVQSAPEAPLSHFDYYRLCLSAHYTTVASYVPTDVDQQIRFRLWDPALPLATLTQMAELVLSVRDWDTRPLSRREISAPKSGERLGGHLGEWFSVAAGAYGALRRKSADLAAEVAGRIIREVDRHGQIYSELKTARDGVGLLKAATIIAHNLGDLDRVLEMWKVPADDPLMQKVFRAGHADALSPQTSLVEAGALNKSMMALENHRHFALRAVKPLRRSPDLLLPIGPFFDGWGRIVARHPQLSATEVADIVEALVLGWERLGSRGGSAAQRVSKTPDAPVPLGYPRALAGILDAFPGGMSALAKLLPARTARDLKAGPLRALIQVPQARFEEHRASLALKGVLKSQ
jgi:hypothetical protein